MQYFPEKEFADTIIQIEQIVITLHLYTHILYVKRKFYGTDNDKSPCSYCSRMVMDASLQTE